MGKLKSLPNRLASLPSRLSTFQTGEQGRQDAAPWRKVRKFARVGPCELREPSLRPWRAFE